MAATPARNWFEQGGGAYARFRPEYPPQLAAALAGLAPARDRALDVGCGTGQLTLLLAQEFGEVIGVDPSADQIAHASAHPRIRYERAPAESLPLPDHSVDLVCAAQSAHWFDRPRFYGEVRRVARPGSALALVSYGVLRLDPQDGAGLDARFSRFYRDEIGPYWPPERQLVDDGYAGIDFPFEELPSPGLVIHVQWDLAAFLGYVGTWSAAARAREAGREDLLLAYADELAAAWGDPARRRSVQWPVNMRLGRLP